MLIQSKKPAQWSTCNIVPIPKSGNLEEVGNYRRIALSAVIAKIINKMLLNRIQPYINPLSTPKWVQIRYIYNGTHPCTEKVN